VSSHDATHMNKPGRPRLEVQEVTADPRLGSYDGGTPEWVRWLDDKSVAAMPAEGGAIITMEWPDLCAAVAPQLQGIDAAFVGAADAALPGAIASLEASLARALDDVRHGKASSPEDDVAPPLVATIAAAAAECALRVLVARAANRTPTDLVPVTKALDVLPRAYASGAAHSLPSERGAERIAPRATAAAAILAYLVSAPYGPNTKQGGWIGGQIERGKWNWFEAAVVPFTFTASVARMVAAGCTWPGRFSVALSAARGRVVGARA
jgi:hypothetical protein